MAHVTFYQDFVFTPPEDRRTSVKYLAGKTYPNVRRLAADLAIAQGKAVELKTPRRRKPRAP